MKKVKGIKQCFWPYSHFWYHYISSISFLSALTILVPSVTYLSSFVAKFYNDWLQIFFVATIYFSLIQAAQKMERVYVHRDFQ